MVMSARDQEMRTFMAPQGRSARLRFPRWTRFKSRTDQELRSFGPSLQAVPGPAHQWLRYAITGACTKVEVVSKCLFENGLAGTGAPAGRSRPVVAFGAVWPQFKKPKRELLHVRE